jgi:hypothetical protein
MQARKLTGILAQKKINEPRRLTSEQRLLIALELSDFASAALHLASSKKR